MTRNVLSFLLTFMGSGIFERLRAILNEAQLEKRVQYMIEVMFAVRKDKFKVSSIFRRGEGQNIDILLLSSVCTSMYLFCGCS